MTNHLAIMRNPWMDYLIQGIKTIESRISQKRIAPWRQVEQDDWIYFRLSGDFVVTHKAQVRGVAYHSGIGILDKLRRYKNEIGIDATYIRSKLKCNYLTLMWLDTVIPLEENVFPHTQKGQKAWFTDFNVIEPHIPKKKRGSGILSRYHY